MEVSQQGMVVDKGVGGNKKCPRMPTGIKVCHTSVVVGVVDHGEWWYQLVRLLSRHPRFVFAKWHRFWKIGKYNV